MTTRLATDVFDGFFSERLEYKPPDPAYVACNPSVHFDGTTWRCVVRCINYRLATPGKPCYVPERPHTQNVMLELGWTDGGFERPFVGPMAYPMADRTGKEKSGYPISGYEDCRLFQWKGKLFCSATTCHLSCQLPPRHGNRDLVLLELDSEYAMVDCIPLRGPWSSFYQKNWIPCPDGDNLRFVYSLDRSLVIGVAPSGHPGAYAMDCGAVKHGNDIDWRAVGNHRGSSPAILMPSGQRLVLAHGEGYQSRFMLLAGEGYRVTHQTELFNFRVVNEVEFAAGMAVDWKRQRVVCSYSVRDATVELGVFPLESVMQKMERIS